MKRIHEKIVSAIVRIWKQPIPLTGEVLSFLNSTFGITCASELEHAMQEEDSADIEMILEMLFFPDFQLRCVLEPLLENKTIPRERSAHVVEALFKACPCIQVVFPEESGPVKIPASPDQIALFVSRLFLDRSLDPDICREMQSSLPSDETAACRILLRCRNFKCTTNKKQVVVTFIQRSVQGRFSFMDLFEILIDVLSDAPDSADLASAFIEKRKQAKKTLDSIQEFEQKKDQYSMEYLMMQRYPVPLDSFEQTFENLQKLDVIINDILCFPVPYEPVLPNARDLGQFDPKNDMADLFNVLS